MGNERNGKMKSRIIAAPQQVLSYGLDETQCMILDAIVKGVGIEHKVIAKEKANEKVGYLCGFKGFSKTGGDCGNPPEKQCLIFSGIQRKSIDRLLSELRASSLNISLKAMVTPSNQSWALKDLIDELEKEHKMMTRGQA